MRFLLALALLVLVAPVHAAPYEDDILRLEVPDGFEGPRKQAIDPQALAIAFRKVHTGERGTVLLITAYNFGDKLAGVPRDKLGAGAEKYLLDFLAGVARQRTSYQATRPEQIVLGGLPAARARWTGILQGFQMSGTMYCAIVGTRVVNLHAQDFDGAPPANMAQLIKAIETVRFK